eukprot:1381841-Pyramimonas_sp.AAC.1
MAVVGDFADWVWQAKGSPARLRKAFLAMQCKFEDAKKVTWAHCRGPLAAAWLSLRRIDWQLCDPMRFRSDRGQVVHLLRQAPSDVLTLLEQGIMRWQGRRMLAHYPAHYQGFQVWGRALALGHQD